ncbi:hypothetical protein KHW15_11425 [Pseudomonas syringae]|uniref:hypothetical protein n=1 Tax=Pseudomonas syringae TaxID=317 RepID=UPI001BCA705E|nr:hypothetical protein [Pseudomonas syringae]MBS7426194.1 hypothetical protein [Pseudomonas syringae]MBS7432243.1 hypothetical protein [Pseudomonas syringae]QVI82635.1 hypothetical protein KHW15_11425 [Pseudomonas syringae]
MNLPDDPGLLNSLKLLECYCDITKQNFDFDAIGTPAAAAVISGLCGSMEYEDLICSGLGTRRAHLKKIITACRNAGMCTDWKGPVGPRTMPPQCRSLWINQSSCLDVLALEYWSAWPVTHRTGETVSLHLSNLWHSHGPEFVRKFHEQCRIHTLKKSKCGKEFINGFAAFLSTNAEIAPVDTFYDSIKLYHFFKVFRKYYFDQATILKLNKPARRRGWNNGMHFMEEAFIHAGVWANPPGGRLPRVKATATKGRETNIKHTDDGILIRHKLITPVPVQITDSSAVEQILSKIESDFNVVTNWARSQFEELSLMLEERDRLASAGLVIDCSQRRIGQDLSIENICATYKVLGYETPLKRFVNMANLGVIYRYNALGLAKILCIPSVQILYPHQLWLIAKHPVITYTFISKLDLYDGRGNLKGIVDDGRFRYLVGYKRRRGQALAEQKVLLDEESSRIIDQVLEVTAPLREYLRIRGDDNWRKLFLSSGHGLSYPKAANFPGWNKSRFARNEEFRKTVHSEFQTHTQLRGKCLDNFIFEITPNSVRASSVVVQFIKNPSTQSLSDNLGHETYRPDLASSYLPDEILDYFKSRHVRVFQRWLIIQSMKGSVKLLEAASFGNIDELDQFMRNNVFGDITGYLKDPENLLSTKDGEGKVYLAVSPQALTALLSIRAAINFSKRQHEISFKAGFWSRVGELVIHEIESGHDELLKSYVEYAEENCNPHAMEQVIYEA